ncbi:unnamed protein product [Rotaria socialis]|uniref:Uncharacterized protein n=1 Tax=Rotaria socialis TaxID=392032 RepID=A0A817XST5_9BILA|nr:unnamed protein product [Rotaria socialis]CAF3372406.1 unnamed protein product [Rotaria socialis]CAF3762983.1 unnamed protein product [Rotaria socialis]CAF4354219.1 unnamed protein product [Rotaria socialis]CAF4473969.1 unnamed protein product [Rotaria socialis]
MPSELAQHMRNLQEIIGQLNIYESDDKSVLTREYGFLKFDEDPIGSNTRLSQYIRMALDTDAATVVKFMEEGWHLPNPDLIISVIGGGQQFHMSPHLRQAFQQGLVIAAATTNAWVITTGVNTGVVKEVGEAINKYRYTHQKYGLDISCIGIGSWKYTAGCEQLIRPETPKMADLSNPLNAIAKSSRYHARYRNEANQMDEPDEYFIRSYVTKQREQYQRDLEPNHTHFLLFDDGSTSTNNMLSQRAAMEKYARFIHVPNTPTDILTPIVMVLVEGGPFSVRTICQALESSTPLVVIRESGRAADLVADLYDYFCRLDDHEQRVETGLSNKQNDQTIDTRDDELESILEKARVDNNPWVADIKDDLCRILRSRKNMVTIFQFNSEKHHGNLEDSILEALFNAAKLSGNDSDEQKTRVAELKLASAWNKLDYAQKHVLTANTITKWTESDLCEALLDAVRRDRVDFVELLIDYGTPVGNLTGHNIEQLYAMADHGLPITSDFEEVLPTRNDYYVSYITSEFANCTDLTLDGSLPLGKNSIRELFLWAVFHDRFDLAKYLCSKTWNQTMAPLIAAYIYTLAATMAVHAQAKEHYIKMASQFDVFAKSIIDQCFANDVFFGVNILKQPAVAFNNLQLLSVAQRAECQSFLASDCVQKYLDHKWFGNINYKRQAIYFRVFLCSIIFPLIPIFAVFLPYVHEHREIVRSNKNQSKYRNPAMVRTVIVSDNDPVGGSIPWSKRISYFYRAPIVRFYYNIIFFALFLSLFSYVILFDYFPLNIYGESRSNIKNLPLPISEILLHICLWSLIVEELRQFILMDASDYFATVWNWIDLTAIVVYILGLVTRFIVREGFFAMSKILLCLDLIIWFLATLRIFTAFERLGPKLVMILNTMRDLLFFLCFIIIFLFAFSVTSWSLINSVSEVHWEYSPSGKLLNATVTITGNHTWSWKLLKDITDYGVRKVFAQIDPIVGNDSYSNTAFILTIIFVAISNVLLLNVLIALFNVTIQNVEEKSHDIWRCQRFVIVDEYSTKTPLPPPFNIVYYIFLAIRCAVKRIQSHHQQRRSSTTETLLNDIKTIDKLIQSQFKVTDAMQRESAIASDYWRSILKSGEDDQTETTMHNIERKLDNMRLRMEASTSITSGNHHGKQQINRESDV